jgi:hypothetical protein
MIFIGYKILDVIKDILWATTFFIANMLASGKLSLIKPENNSFLVETNLPTPIWQGL